MLGVQRGIYTHASPSLCLFLLLFSVIHNSVLTAQHLTSVFVSGRFSLFEQPFKAKLHWDQFLVTFS